MESVKNGKRVIVQTASVITLVGIILYIILDVVLAFLPPHYNILRNAESDYGNGPFSYLMEINFIIRFIFSSAAVIGIGFVTTPLNRSRLGLILLSIWSVMSGLLAFFPDSLEGQPLTPSGRMHLILAGIAFLTALIGIILLTQKLKNDPMWTSVHRALKTWSMTALMGVVLLVLSATLLKHHRLHRIANLGGLYERIFLLSVIVWIGVAAMRAYKLAD